MKRFVVASASALGLLFVGPALLAADGDGDGDGEVQLTRGPDGGDDDEVVEVEEAARAALADGVALFQRARAGDFIMQFTNEKLEQLARPEQLALLQSEGRFDDIFLDGDEAFEFEIDASMGAAGGGGARPVHDVSGGADGASCRGCHFVGGPDGAGSSTQRALFRGDGARVSSAIVRDAPHVMGLGYISRLAREMDAELLAALVEAEDIAATTSVPVVLALSAKGIDFGELVARPGGEVDRSRVSGVSPDLVVRPFGHKGRHADLVRLVDEALEVHHGLQTASRLRDTARDGVDDVDPDGDGIVAAALWRDEVPGAEASSAQAVLLAGYLSLLGVPEIHPPRRPDLLVTWARGRQLLDETGCTLCHVEQLSVIESTVEVGPSAGFDTSLIFDLTESGQEPRALRTDDGPAGGPGGRIPIFAYTDLKRHDLGPALADGVDESLVAAGDGDGDGEVLAVRGAEWLTRSLWGVADTAPYLHDGRAATLHDAIIAHGGEAAGMRDAYLALDAADQASLRVFLTSLTRSATVLVE